MHARALVPCLVLLACSGAPSRQAAPGPGEPPPKGRLPTDVRPVGYALSLEIDPEAPRFAGSVAIEATLDGPRRTIWLHAERLEVSEASVTAGGREQRAVFATAEAGFASLTVAEPVGPGPATLRMRFAGPFDTANDALFVVSTEDRRYVFTQFEPLSARRAFPCFDEPSFKTPFDVDVVVPVGMVARGNAGVASEQTRRDGRRRVRFARTAPLPTYLVALAVGPLDVFEAPDVAASVVRAQPLPLQGLAARGRAGAMAFSMDRATQYVTALEAWFGTPYPYDKLDLLALPDFPWAMENAGLVTFREGDLLIDPKHVSFPAEKDATLTIAHELAHQWFGNLVTMAWWDDLWLNEAFATWMSYRILERFEPTYGIRIDELADGQAAMEADSLVSARRIRQPIESAGDVLDAFDGITYSKGGAVITMFEHWIGEEAFRRGVHGYLEAHRFGSATVDDLLRALSEAAGRDVATPFRTFLDQPGVPLVEASVRCDGASVSVGLRQSRYLPSGSTGSRDATWQVPVCVGWLEGGTERTACTLLTGPEGTLALETKTCPTVLHPNRDGGGYYRWALDTPGLAALVGAASQLGDAERLSLANNVMAGFRAGRIPAADALDAMTGLAGDVEPRVVDLAGGLFQLAEDHLVPEAQRPEVRRRAAATWGPVLARLGWRGAPGEGRRTGELRAQAAAIVALLAEEPGARAEAARLGRAWLEDPAAVDPDLVETTLIAAVRTGDAAFYERLATRLAGEPDAAARAHLIAALGAAREPALVARTQALALDSLQPSETMDPIRGQLADPATRRAAWAWMTANFDAVAARVGEFEAAYTPLDAGVFCSEDDARAVEAFYRPRLAKLTGAERALAQALEQIRNCAAVVAGQGEGARRWFAR